MAIINVWKKQIKADKKTWSILKGREVKSNGELGKVVDITLTNDFKKEIAFDTLQLPIQFTLDNNCYFIIKETYKNNKGETQTASKVVIKKCLGFRPITFDSNTDLSTL